MTAALLAAALAAVAAAQAPAPSPQAQASAAQWLIQTLSTEAYGALQDGGALVVQGEGPEQRVQYAHWRALERLQELAPAAIDLAGALQALEQDEPLPPSAAGLGRLSALPADGLMTPRLQAAAQTLAALSADLSALGSNESVSALLARRKPLFDTPWGKEFAARTQADAVDAPAVLAGLYFDEDLAGPGHLDAADEHFLSYEGARRRAWTDALSHDEREGAASPALRAELAAYLRDQRLLSQIERLRAGLLKLAQEADFRKDVASLEAVATALRAHPRFLQELRDRVGPVDPASPSPRLTSSGLHVTAPERLGRYELGDRARLSGAYWVDGLGEGRKVYVDETTFVETPTGVAQTRTRRVKRADGGPYVFERTVDVDASRDLVLEALISSAGSNTLADRAVAPVAGDFAQALKRLADADAAALSCRFKDAGYAQLARDLEAPAREKRQYARLLKLARSRANEAARHEADLEQVERLIADSHADASVQACRYDESRTREAIERLRLLPAGCDRYLPQLQAQLAFIRRRAADQEAFQRAAQDSASRRRACAFAAAADKAAEALSILDADPDARCGDASAQADALEDQPAALRAAQAWHDTLADALDSAQKASTPDERLADARAATARIDSLPDAGCYAPERGQAEQIAAAAANALATTPSAEQPPADADVAKAAAAISAQRKQMVDAMLGAPATAAEPPPPPPQESAP